MSKTSATGPDICSACEMFISVSLSCRSNDRAERSPIHSSPTGYTSLLASKFPLRPKMAIEATDGRRRVMTANSISIQITASFGIGRRGPRSAGIGFCSAAGAGSLSPAALHHLILLGPAALVAPGPPFHHCSQSRETASEMGQDAFPGVVAGPR